MKSYQTIVIGAGPGGYAAAARAAAQGPTLLVERDQLGGTCLNRGCIPTKAFCRSAETVLEVRSAGAYGVELPGLEAPVVDMDRVVARKDQIVQTLRQGVAAAVAKADVVSGEARFTGPHAVAVGEEQYTAPRIIVATGSQPALLPIPGASLAMTSDTLLDATALPPSMCIIGGGVIGMEFASVFAAFGTEVTVVEYCREILPPFDRDIASRLRTALKRRGVRFVLSAQVTAIERGDAADLADQAAPYTVRYLLKDKPCDVRAAAVLMAVGRKAVVPAGLAELGAALTRRGALEVDENWRTTLEGVYAIGDCNGRCMLAHAATAQAEAVTGADVDMSVIPSAVFSVPECAMAGLTEDQCRERGLQVTAAKALFRANGKAQAMGETDGLVKILLEPDGHIAGAHICGPHAADLIAELALAMSAGLTAQQVARTIHSHPSLSEAVAAALRQ